MLSRGFPPLPELIVCGCGEWGRTPKLFRGVVDDKHALITKTGAIPEKGVDGVICLPGKCEDHLTLVIARLTALIRRRFPYQLSSTTSLLILQPENIYYTSLTVPNCPFWLSN